MTTKTKDNILIETTNEKWIKSIIVRGVGAFLGIIWGILSTVLDGDKWIDSIFLVILFIIVFSLVITIPDKIIFGKNLKKKKLEDFE